jgi:hypothetical protein
MTGENTVKASKTQARITKSEAGRQKHFLRSPQDQIGQGG